MSVVGVHGFVFAAVVMQWWWWWRVLAAAAATAHHKKPAFVRHVALMAECQCTYLES